MLQFKNNKVTFCAGLITCIYAPLDNTCLMIIHHRTTAFSVSYWRHLVSMTLQKHADLTSGGQIFLFKVNVARLVSLWHHNSRTMHYCVFYNTYYDITMPIVLQWNTGNTNPDHVSRRFTEWKDTKELLMLVQILMSNKDIQVD